MLSSSYNYIVYRLSTFSVPPTGLNFRYPRLRHLCYSDCVSRSYSTYAATSQYLSESLPKMDYRWCRCVDPKDSKDSKNEVGNQDFKLWRLINPTGSTIPVVYLFVNLVHFNCGWSYVRSNIWELCSNPERHQGECTRSGQD